MHSLTSTRHSSTKHNKAEGEATTGIRMVRRGHGQSEHALSAPTKTCIILRNPLLALKLLSSRRKILTVLIWRSTEIQVRCGRDMVFYSHQLLIPRGAKGVPGELDLGTFTFFNTKIYYFLLLFVVLYFMETRSAVTRILRCDMYGWRF